MVDSADKKEGRGANWQESHSAAPGPSADGGTNVSQKKQKPPSQTQSSLIEQAKQFLGDESIKNASRSRKVAFLEKKGLQGDDIEKLLGPQVETSISSQEEDKSGPEMRTIHDSTNTPASEASSLQKQPVSPPPRESTQQISNRDIPPIITYPEFLLKPQKPPPLVTFDRLAHAAYTLAGISLLTYGASKYLVEPMLATLTEARHELAETTLQDLETLNTKLEANVSHIPVIPSSTILKKRAHGGEQVDVDDEESVSSDPTELFHRDVATQTSPQLSRSTSISSPTNRTQHHPSPTDHQTARLTSLHASLDSLLTSTTSTPSSNALRSTVSHFQNSLDDIQTSHSPYQSEYSSIYTTSTARDHPKKKAAETSEAAKFKAEIRALKGAFLSSRNFPVARPATASYATAVR